MAQNKATWIVIGLAAVTSVGALAFYISSLHQQLEQAKFELQQLEEHNDSLESSLDDSQDKIAQQDEELGEKEASLIAKEEELDSKVQELNASKAELDRQKQQAQALIATADGLKADMRTVTECFGGITLAFVSDSQAEAISYLSSVQNQCEDAAEIVEDL